MDNSEFLGGLKGSNLDGTKTGVPDRVCCSVIIGPVALIVMAVIWVLGLIFKD